MREATVEDPDLSMNAMAHRIRPQVKVVPDNCEARSSRPASTPARCLARRSAMRPDQGTGGGELELKRANEIMSAASGRSRGNSTRDLPW